MGYPSRGICIRDVVRLSLKDALDATDDPKVDYHIREAFATR